MPAVAERSIRIIVDRDGLRAHLALTDTLPSLLTRESLLAALKQQGIPVTDAINNRIKEIEALKHEGPLPTEPVLLAEGREPVEGSGATFELSPQLLAQAVTDDDVSQADFHRSQILTVEAGTVIGVLNPEVKSVPGIDVYGKPVTAKSPANSIKLGSNVSLATDGRSVIADKSGKIHITRREVAIQTVVDTPGDVDFATGNIEAPGDILIGGTIRDTFKVKSSGSITVRGAIEAAEVTTTSDLHVNGGITSHHQGLVTAGGEIFTRFANEAQLEAGGDITITREALNCRIRTGGHLMIGRGKLIGGWVYARCGAEIGQIGNDANIKTEIILGIDPKTLLEASSATEIIKKKREAIDKIRQSVQPLMAQIKRLTPAQRERAMELLYQADAMEQEIAAHELCKAAAAKQKLTPDGHEICLIINKIAYPAVSIVFGDKVTTLHRERKGPFKVVCRMHNRTEEILAIDKVSGSISVLNSREYHPTPETTPS